jgi:hypothetical protein
MKDCCLGHAQALFSQAGIIALDLPDYDDNRLFFGLI